MDTVDVVTKAGFTIHPEISVFTPYQVLRNLGFVLNSVKMCVSDRKNVMCKGCSRNYPQEVGGPQTLFCPVGGGCFVDSVSEGWGVTCPGGQGIFDP